MTEEAPIHVAILEIRWTGGDRDRAVECIQAGIEIAVQLMGGFDNHGIGPQGVLDDGALPIEVMSFERFLLADPEWAPA